MTRDLLERQYAVRSNLVELLQRDLVGPSDPHELIDDPPILRYSSGILYPRSDDPVEPEQPDAEEDGDEATRPEPTVASANARYPRPSASPSSRWRSPVRSCAFRIAAARFRFEDGGEQEDAVTAWRRHPLEIDPVEVDPVEVAADGGIHRQMVNRRA